METTYYSILGIGENASEETIKCEYRKLAKKYHPDTNPGDKWAEEKFKEAGDAYEVLGNSDKRKAYDLKLSKARGQRKPQPKQAGTQSGFQGMSGFQTGNMSSGFQQFFGFHPDSVKIDEEKLDANKNKKAKPMDVTDMFERYMGIKK